jgi:NAD(P)-dependent dehydrogenase (short-subunit alcohol dehydrogenase family)
MTRRERSVALVTGGNKGIGLETVRRLAELGMTVLLGARDEQRGKEAVAALRQASLDVQLVLLDTTDAESVARAAAEIDARFGQLDVLVNNAGIAVGTARPSRQGRRALEGLFATNVFGPLAVTQACLPLLERSPGARIVNVSTTLSSLLLTADPESRFAAYGDYFGYALSKTALNAITVGLANELRASGIKVNAACPGYVATDLNGHSGPRTPRQGAEMVVRLATLADDGPTGGFFDEAGPVPW